MTEKKERILNAALQLFAKEGFAATSTSKVANEAGVSEGLIFRHFKNKEGLLQAILDNGAERGKALFADIVLSTNPAETILKTIELPFKIKSDQYELWRLIYALKWQTNQYDPTPSEPIRRAISNAFEQLEYKDPDAETEFLMMVIDGAATAMLLRTPSNKEAVLNAIKAKYNLASSK